MVVIHRQKTLTRIYNIYPCYEDYLNVIVILYYFLIKILIKSVITIYNNINISNISLKNN